MDAGLGDATDKTSAEAAELLEVHKAAAIAQSAIHMSEATRDQRVVTFFLLPVLAVGCVVFCIVRDLDNTLRQSVTELTDGSNQVASASNQVASSSQTLAQDASEQAAMIEETSAAADQLSAQSAALRHAAGTLGQMVGGTHAAPAYAQHLTHEPDFS